MCMQTSKRSIIWRNKTYIHDWVEDGEAEVSGSALTGGNTANHLGVVLQCLLGVECPLELCEHQGHDNSDGFVEIIITITSSISILSYIAYKNLAQLNTTHADIYIPACRWSPGWWPWCPCWSSGSRGSIGMSAHHVAQSLLLGWDLARERCALMKTLQISRLDRRSSITRLTSKTSR